MSRETISVSRRRFVGGLITVGAAGAAAGAGTFAAFTDSETNSGTISAGTINLGLDGNASFGFSTALAPTETTTDSVTLVNDGSVSGSLDVDVNYTENDGDTGSQDATADEVAQNLEVQTLDYDGDRTGQIDGEPTPTLADLANNDQTTGESTGNDLVDLPDPGSGTDFTVGLRLKDVSDTFQGDGIAITFDFHLNQNDSQ